MAIHEAAHAVANVLSDNIASVTVHLYPHDGDLGETLGSGGFETEDEADALVVGLLAGLAAERRLGTPEAVALAHADDDLAAARNILWRLGRRADLRRFHARARRLVDEHWAAVRRIAALVEHRATSTSERTVRVGHEEVEDALELVREDEEHA